MGMPLYFAMWLKKRKQKKNTLEVQAPEVVVDEATELTSAARVQIPERVLEADEETENVA